mmetsp:Transcript_3080/g.4496  ORF Transcript_3080/g.4496 Transcript_3080/m.4496 type:complete len:356 (+) Transcript_3080:25-1092(+)
MSNCDEILPPAQQKASSGIKVSVFGAGSFGTALSFVLGLNGHKVVMLCRDEKVAQHIREKHENPKHQSGFTLPDNVSATTSIEECLKDTNYILHAIPTQLSFDFLSHRRQHILTLAKNVPIISVSKGIHVRTKLLMKDVIVEALQEPDGEKRSCAFMSGPSFAVEILQRYPTGIVVASNDEALAKNVQKLFSSVILRVYTSSDVVGVELAGALKNVFAIAAGIVSGCGLGYNSTTGLVTRGLNEMRQLAVALGADENTLAGLAGLGDLMLTCFGSLSRNRTVGFRLGQGEQLDAIIKSMNEVAEGVPTTQVACELAKQHKLDLPIIHTVNRVLNGDISPKQALKELMSRPLRSEF